MTRRWWLEVIAGVVVAVVGAVLTLRPFTSLSVLVLLVGVAMVVTGVAVLVRARRAGSRREAAVGVAWLAGGAAALAWPDITTGGLALVVGVAMIGDGVLDVVGGIRGTVDQRIASVLGGVAGVIFGVLALSWPDVTLLAVAVLFGARTVLFGLRTAWSAWRDRHATAQPEQDPRAPGRLRRAGHLAGAAAALVVALLLASVSASLHASQAEVDGFYDTPDDLPDEPGVLLDAEPFDRDVPEGATAYRILYTTTRGDDEPAVASALVVVPEGADGPVPVVAWAHGTTGFARGCAPSVMDAGLGAGAFFLLDEVLAEGWALVATDYVGLGTEGPHPYLIGDRTAPSVLDAVRAARQLDEVEVSDETVVWGHSQGGGVALWTGQIAPTYAPDVELAGVAALAPASDLPGLVGGLRTITGGSIFASYVVAAYAATYDELALADLVRPTGRPTVEAAARRCLDASALASALSSVAFGMEVFRPDVEARLEDRLTENVPTGPFEMPVLVGQGADDSLVLAEVQAEFVAGLCAEGEVIDLRTHPGRDHVPLVEPDSPLVPELVAWTHARLAGEPAGATCSSS